jgi:hypothetical protein
MPPSLPSLSNISLYFFPRNWYSNHEAITPTASYGGKGVDMFQVYAATPSTPARLITTTATLREAQEVAASYCREGCACVVPITEKSLLNVTETV